MTRASFQRLIVVLFVYPALVVPLGCGRGTAPAPDGGSARGTGTPIDDPSEGRDAAAASLGDGSLHDASTEGSVDGSPTDAATSDEPVELLHAVPSSVAVSSAYRYDEEQVKRLVDGSLESGWNSLSGDLVGAWISFRVPESARIAYIEMTSGLTRMHKGNDLFLFNHRIKKVRVLRGEKSLGEFPLKIDVREPQKLPISGPGGTYRIEIREVVPGSRRNWREACVSDLKIWGHAKGARPLSLQPVIAIGALPAEESADSRQTDGSAPTKPPSSAQELHVFKLLAEEAERSHGVKVESLGRTTFTNQKGDMLASHLYRYGSFESWRAAKMASGQWSKIVARANALQKACVKGLEASAKQAEKRAERLHAKADRTGRDEDREAAEIAEQGAYVSDWDYTTCNGWSKIYPDVETTRACSPDKMVLVVHEIRKGEKALSLGRRIFRSETSSCTSGYPRDSIEGDDSDSEGAQEITTPEEPVDFAGQLKVVDIDRDQSVEVLATWTRGRPMSVGRFDIDAGDDAQIVQVIRANGSAQLSLELELNNSFESSKRGQTQPSSWTKMWFEDVSGDGRVDLVTEETIFSTICECHQLDAQEEMMKAFRDWSPPVKSPWSFSDLYCTEYAAEEPVCNVVTKAKRTVRVYNPTRDRWEE